MTCWAGWISGPPSSRAFMIQSLNSCLMTKTK
jgi:hypothetical protein